MILTVTLNASVDQTLFLDTLLPGDTNRVQKSQMDAGGKGVNLSRVAHSLGASTLASGLVGGASGDFLKGLLNRDGVPFRFATTSEPTRTNLNIETTDGKPPTTLNARGPLVTEQEWDALCALLQEVIPQADWVCFCGSIPPGLPIHAYQTLAGLTQGKKVLIDADGDALKLAMSTRPTLIKPNFHEAERLMGEPILDPEEDVACLREETGVEIAIISLGSRGAVLACEQGVYRGFSPKVQAVSTIGSGDSMLGAFLARLQAGDPIPLAFQWGLAAGAATATTDGTQIGPPHVIELLFEEASVKQVG